MVATLILAAGLVIPLGLRGLALSDTLAIAITLIGLHVVVTGKWRWGLELGWRSSFPRLLTSATISWAAAATIGPIFKSSSPWLQVLLGGGAALSTYLFVAWIIRLPELGIVLALFRRTQTIPHQPEPTASTR